MKSLRKSVCLMLVLTVAVGASADETKGKKDKAKKAPSPSQRFVEKLELTDAQKDLVAAVDKEFAPKLAEINKTRLAMLTAEQKQAEKDARKAAKEAGKTTPETRKAVDEALNLTEEQKIQMKEIQKKTADVNGQLVAALKKFLTAEQQEKLPKPGGGKKGGKKKNAE